MKDFPSYFDVEWYLDSKDIWLLIGRWDTRKEAEAEYSFEMDYCLYPNELRITEHFYRSRTEAKVAPPEAD